MKKMMKLTFVMIGLLIVSGCATHQKFVQKFDGWIGKDINTFIAQIGYPDSTFVLPNKNKVYVYERSRVDSVPTGPVMGYGYYGYGVVGYNYQTVTTTCKLFIETDKKDKIVKWGHRGKCLSY